MNTVDPFLLLVGIVEKAVRSEGTGWAEGRLAFGDLIVSGRLVPLGFGEVHVNGWAASASPRPRSRLPDLLDPCLQHADGQGVAATDRSIHALTLSNWLGVAVVGEKPERNGRLVSPFRSSVPADWLFGDFRPPGFHGVGGHGVATGLAPGPALGQPP
jgi:hypothetical protein